MKRIDINDVEKNNMLAYRYVRGSVLYGLNIPGKSDTDYGGVYILPLEKIVGLGQYYVEQVSDERGDRVYMEMGRYMELLLKSNPNIIESLFVPPNMVIGDVHPLIRKIIDCRDSFITMDFVKSTLGYAYAQIKKARSLNKKVFNTVEEKGILEFCNVIDGNMTEPVDAWLQKRGMKQEYCGLVSIDHMKDIYKLYYDWGSHIINEVNGRDICFLEINGQRVYPQKRFDLILDYMVSHYTVNSLVPDEPIEKLLEKPLGYRGIVNRDDSSQDIRLSAIPKEDNTIVHLSSIEPLCFMHFASEAYSFHCRKYHEYKEWELKRNPERYESTIRSGKGYDAKNMCHCIRLLHMADEVVSGRGFNVVRTWDRELLMEIRNGEREYDEMIEYAEKTKRNIDGLIPSSSLPKQVDIEFVQDLLVASRIELVKNI